MPEIVTAFEYVVELRGTLDADENENAFGVVSLTGTASVTEVNVPVTPPIFTVIDTLVE